MACDKAIVKEKVKELPLSPGVYIMKNSDGDVIYVGKAVKLKNRVSSYFVGKKDNKTTQLVNNVADFDYIITESEVEALLLEESLIKKHNPRYNIMLKDGKGYPVIRMTKEEFPRFFSTRNIKKDGSLYWGPFPGTGAIKSYMALIENMTKLRRCIRLKKRDNPCLYYHMGKCSGPCAGKISKEDYAVMVRKARSLLSGKTVQLKKELERDMKDAADKMEYEEAGRIRDILVSLELVKEPQSIVDWDSSRRDYIGFAAAGGRYVFAVLQFTEGKATGRDLFHSRYPGEDWDAICEFVIRYYDENRDIPAELYLHGEDTVLDLISEWFKQHNHNVSVLKAESKRDKAIMNMVLENGSADLHRRLRSEGDLTGIEILQDALGLKKLPVRIEGFDIAQLSGYNTVASLVAFRNGIPDKGNYRHFKMASLKPGEIDDFRSISEAVARRYTRLINEKKDLPDLLMIDGGQGQVNAAWSVLSALGIDDVLPVVGLAKREEIIYFPGNRNPLDLPEGDPALKVLQYVRDETHRFATAYNQKLRKKEINLQTLESVPGIGPKKAAKLIQTLGSLKAIGNAEIDEICQIASISEDIAETIKLYLERK